MPEKFEPRIGAEGEPRFDEIGREGQKQEENIPQEYNFEIMKEIEPAMISLTQQLKDKIEAGEYSALMSDEIGGRIPTLVLRKILKEKGPNQDIKAYFLASGQIYLPGWRDVEDDMGMPKGAEISNPEGYEKVKKYLKGLNFGDGKLLVVTQYMFHGNTLRRIGAALGDAGVKNLFDFAVLHGSGLSSSKNSISDFEKLGVHTFVGQEEYMSCFDDEHKELGGVRKKIRGYSPIVEHVVTHLQTEGREISRDEFNKIFEIKPDDDSSVIIKKSEDVEKKKRYDARLREPLTEQEIREIKEKIKLARRDVNTMANRVMRQVWNN